MRKLLFTLPILGMFFLSCENDHLNDNLENDSQNYLAKNSGFYLDKIDNGLDGQILVFDSAESYRTIQEDLYNQTQLYMDRFQPMIPKDIDDDQLEVFLNNNNYNEDIIYENFEKNIGFNSFRLKLNKDISSWMEIQSNPLMMVDEENDPDNNTLVLESDRVLYNMRGEVIVLDSLKNPIIYKAFDWGHLAVDISDVEIIKEINISRITKIEDINSIIKGNSKIKVIRDKVDYISACTSDNIKSMKHVFSSNGQHNVKSIIKNRKTPFDSSGKFDRLLIKTKGYLWKKGKWKHKSVWLVSGFTSKRNIPNLPISWWKYICDSGDKYTRDYPAKTKCALKFEYNGGPIDNVAWKDNTIYAYHGQGTFTFTVDFYGTQNSGHETYQITN